MPATTTRLALPYPTPDDTVDVPRDVQALATKLDGIGKLNALTSAPVLDVGLLGQVRAGRQLAVADFTSLGLSQPVGLFNLGSLTNLGSGGALANKGAVPFGVGVNGLASTCAVFAGSTGQALYIADTGAADPFRIRTGSAGAWFRTAKRGSYQGVVGRIGPNSSTGNSYYLLIDGSNNTIMWSGSLDGGPTNVGFARGVSDVVDDRWHFVVGTHDGTALRLYLDGVLEATGSLPGPFFASAEPLNIGAQDADGSAAAVNAHYGRIDEAFVTADVLNEDQIRALYCARIPHGYSTTPTRVNLNVRRQKRGGPFAVGDFPAQPLRLYNFTAGSLADQGSNGVALTAGAISNVAGPNGAPTDGKHYAGIASDHATDAGLPSGTASRSYGLWFKTATATAGNVMAWGATPGTNDARLTVDATGTLYSYSGSDALAGPFSRDGQWHFAVVTEDNAAGDGVRRKLYLDGRLVGGSTVMNSLTLGGASKFRVGANSDGAGPFPGQASRVFVTGVALTFEQQAALYAKGSQALLPSPKNPGDHIESMDATNVLATFDTLDSTAQIDMGVEA